jgi:predicted aspartyl protease
MTGTFSINHQPVIILFDSGATHSFISSKCGTKIGLDLYPTSGAYMIATLAVKFPQTKFVEVC